MSLNFRGEVSVRGERYIVQGRILNRQIPTTIHEPGKRRHQVGTELGSIMFNVRFANGATHTSKIEHAKERAQRWVAELFAVRDSDVTWREFQHVR